MSARQGSPVRPCRKHRPLFIAANTPHAELATHLDSHGGATPRTSPHRPSGSMPDLARQLELAERHHHVSVRSARASRRRNARNGMRRAVVAPSSQGLPVSDVIIPRIIGGHSINFFSGVLCLERLQICRHPRKAIIWRRCRAANISRNLNIVHERW